MVKINEKLESLEKKNIFLNVTKRVQMFKKNNPKCNLISLGIGDVSKPISKVVIDAMHNAVDDLSDMKTFKGYGSYYGYDFLKQKILDNEYKEYQFSLDEIYISNGTKTDSTSLLELFDIKSKICVTNPMYPIYKEGAKCLNRNVETLTLLEKNDFVAEIPNTKYDIIYICSPNNPIGIAYTYKQLKDWVDYAIQNDSIIIYDNVYESFITSKEVPHSIYEITGAKNVAIELRSFSKKASFTGVRCSYYIIPNEISNNINLLWKERTINRFNGADYIAQKGAEATYLPEAQKDIYNNILYYLENAKMLREIFELYDFKVWGGKDSPFMWVKTNSQLEAWELFDFFLQELEIIIIPGIIFGDNCSKYFRVSALGSKESIMNAIERIKNYYEKNN